MNYCPDTSRVMLHILAARAAAFTARARYLVAKPIDKAQRLSQLAYELESLECAEEAVTGLGFTLPTTSN